MTDSYGNELNDVFFSSLVFKSKFKDKIYFEKLQSVSGLFCLLK